MRLLTTLLILLLTTTNYSFASDSDDRLYIRYSRTACQLSNHDNIDCFKYFDKAFKVENRFRDNDLRVNYVGALLHYTETKMLEPEDSMNKAWDTLMDWKCHDMKPDEDGYLLGMMGKIGEITGQYKLASVMKKFHNYISRIPSEARSDDLVNKGFCQSLSLAADGSNKDLMDWIHAVTQGICYKIDNENPLESIKQVQKYGSEIISRNKERKKSLVNYIQGQVSNYLQDSDIRNFSHVAFYNFNADNPSDEHLTKWARYITEEKFAEFISYSGNDSALKVFIEDLDKNVLSQHVKTALIAILAG